MRLDPDLRHRLVWGWLRLALGYAQMALVVSTLASLIAAGLTLPTWILFACTTAATLLSRVLYHGQLDPRLDGTNHLRKP